MENRNWTIGESVAVKPGVTDPDTGSDIGGWQGRISAIIAGEALILTIQWDSLTLKSMPVALIIVAVKHKHGVYELPLCDLKAPNADTEIQQLVDDYAVWFANR